MTDQQRAALSPDDPEHRLRFVNVQAEMREMKSLTDLLRIIGSKIQVAGWTVYTILICALKISVLFFYLQLTV